MNNYFILGLLLLSLNTLSFGSAFCTSEPTTSICKVTKAQIFSPGYNENYTYYGNFFVERNTGSNFWVIIMPDNIHRESMMALAMLAMKEGSCIGLITETEDLDGDGSVDDNKLISVRLRECP